ncbi:hypothetical protein PIB30_049155 [Stylosanthes scabra]|uniref:G domain-containing protein n=1 Tax=Stylosanthes scabra TaxID=79078 RepID=A0ABU6QGS5_9FABA|nr:hypothetical protein [Stylosanthes scabra]
MVNTLNGTGYYSSTTFSITIVIGPFFLSQFIKLLSLCPSDHNPYLPPVCGLMFQTLRAMPVVNLETPTLCLVGAPNVGKSSLVHVLSTGKLEFMVLKSFSLN